MAFEAIPQPVTYAERLALADRTREDFDLDCTIVVDAMDDRSRARFGDQPNSAILVGPDGVVRLKQPWADPDELEAALPGLLAKLDGQLRRAAAEPSATKTERVALSRRFGKPDDWATLRDELRREGEVTSVRGALELLLDLDLWRARGIDATELLRLMKRARASFDKEPAAEAAFLGSVALELPADKREAVLARLIELAQEGGRSRSWVEGLRKAGSGTPGGPR